MRKESDYSKKLRDPRWQRRRLEVLQHDDWACVDCQRDGETLHVHHLFYIRGREPWEYEIGDLVTLCEDCHADREAALLELRKELRHHDASAVRAMAILASYAGGFSLSDILHEFIEGLAIDAGGVRNG
jgi:hypothetical protein